MRLALTLFAASLLAGCAPAADLRVPAYAGPDIKGRLLVVRAPMVVAPDVVATAGFPDQQSYETATWDAFERALGETFWFSSVQATALPDSAGRAPVFVSHQIMREGKAENRWLRRTVNLPTASRPIARGRGASGTSPRPCPRPARSGRAERSAARPVGDWVPLAPASSAPSPRRRETLNASTRRPLATLALPPRR